MNNRRQFLGTLGKALGAGGLLLPWAGKGALALPADLGKAAQLPVTAAAMPFSTELLQLREIRQELHGCYLRQHDYPSREAYGREWRSLMVDRYSPLVAQIVSCPAKTWTDAVELAEISFQHMAHRGVPDRSDPQVALVYAVLALGSGEKWTFVPSIGRRGYE